MAYLKSTNIFGTLKIHALTQSNSSTTGSLVVMGGAGVNKSLFVKDAINVTGNATIGGTVNGLKVNTATGKILDLSVASFKSGSGTNTGSVTVTSDSATARTLTLGRDITLTGDAARTLTIKNNNKTLAGAGTTLTFGGNFTTSGAHATTLTTVGTTTLTLPKTGTVVSSTDTGTVTNTMLAGSITNDKLTYNTISGVSLGSNLKNLTAGTGLSGTAYNGSSDVTITIDNTVVTLSGTQTLKNKTIDDIKASATNTTADLWSEVTTGSIAIGAGLTTGTLNIDASSAKAHVLNLGTGITGTGLTKTVNIGTRGASGSTTNINIGSATNGSINNTSINGSLGVSGDTGIGGDLTVSGNLIVSGTTTTINTNELIVGDNIITLNSDLPAATPPTENAGIEINRGSSSKVSFLWDEVADKWTVGSGTIIASKFEGNVTGDVTGKVNGLIIDSTTGTLDIANGKTLTVNKTITLGGVDGKAITTNSSLTVGDTVNNGSITIKSSNTTAKIITVNGDATLVSGTMVPTTRTITINSNNGITGGSSDASDLSANRSWTLGLTGQAKAFHDLSTNGIVARTDIDTVAARTITGTTGRVYISDGDGVLRNPTIDIDSNYIGQETITTLGTITTGTWDADTIAVDKGGTGATTHTANALLKGNGTSSIEASNISDTGTLITLGIASKITGNLTVTGTITESSDRRLKTEIKDISNALDKVKNLTGCTFKKENSDKVSMGLIAQDTQKVIPEVVNEGSDGYLGIQYSNIVALLIEAIKEQQEQIDYLKSKVDKKKWWKIF